MVMGIPLRLIPMTTATVIAIMPMADGHTGIAGRVVNTPTGSPRHMKWEATIRDVTMDMDVVTITMVAVVK